MDSKLIQQGLGLYIHIPFCHTKCTYCDFNTYSGLENLINNFDNSISNEIEFWSLNMIILLKVFLLVEEPIIC